tara:strand:+ start:470 stop:1171 length:702 start_codon:yes stop_codon:yes gene_type:complete
MKVLIIIPTLNEEKNISNLVNKILSLYNYNILIIDDNSKDKTKNILKKFKSRFKRFDYLIRRNKKGIGSAHQDGILNAYKNNFDYCISMDADGTHDPKQIKQMIKLIKSKNISVINTSRFVNKKSLEDWPPLRKFLTIFRFHLVSSILGTKFDSSGGFRCYDLNLINKKIFKQTKNKNYFFLIEILYILEKKNYKIIDIPAKLKYRVDGLSKMNIYFVLEALLALVFLRYRSI